MIDFKIDEIDIAARRAAAAAARADGRGGTQRVVVSLVGDIDADMAGNVRAQLEAAPHAAEIDVVVNSGGGDFWESFSIYASLLNHPAIAKRATLVRAESGALLAALGADVRVAVPDLTVLIHRSELAPGRADRWTAIEHLQAADLCAWHDSLLAEIFEYRTGKPAEIFMREMETEDLSPLDWCVRHNLIQRDNNDQTT